MASYHPHDELGLWLGLTYIHGLGNRGLCKLLSAFASPENIYSASYNQLTEFVSEDVAYQIKAGVNQDAIAGSLDWLKTSEHNHIITFADDCYPKALLEINDPPPLLYAKGQLALLNSPCIAVVGSRNASVHGEKNAEEFSNALSQHGYSIVSGMALGIDAAAHRGAIKGSGATIAVVGTGLDIVYPSKHRELAHKIVERGLIISEFVLGTPSQAANFPRRNRIISGLSLGCLVVEANLQSGSLITARLAAEQGREVFAIPGSIHSPVAKGCHQLIKQGAKLVDNIQDIVDELGSLSTFTLNNNLSDVPAETTPLLDLMGFEPISMQFLVAHSGLTSEQLSAMLMVLELENKVASLAGGRYQRIA